MTTALAIANRANKIATELVGEGRVDGLTTLIGIVGFVIGRLSTNKAVAERMLDILVQEARKCPDWPNT